MAQEYDIKAMAEKIKLLRQTATELKEMAVDAEAVKRNADRLLVSVKMLELDVADVADIV